MARSWSKLAKHKVLSGSPKIVPYLPPTRIMNKESFMDFVKKYSEVVVKPSSGSGGTGVMMVRKLPDGDYEIQSGTRRIRNKTLLSTYNTIQSSVNRTYLIQPKLSLARINGRPFDLRVMVQKRKGMDWKVTGIMAKVAGSGYFITNLVRSKGKALPFHTAVQSSNIQGITSTQLQEQIHQTALLIVKRLQSYYRINTVGLDIGIDHKGKVWLIEANFSPDKTYFKRLKDKTIYKRIMAYFNDRN